MARPFQFVPLSEVRISSNQPETAVPRRIAPLSIDYHAAFSGF
jgi:hypothetical protein